MEWFLIKNVQHELIFKVVEVPQHSSVQLLTLLWIHQRCTCVNMPLQIRPFCWKISSLAPPPPCKVPMPLLRLISFHHIENMVIMLKSYFFQPVLPKLDSRRLQLRAYIYFCRKGWGPFQAMVATNPGFAKSLVWSCQLLTLLRNAFLTQYSIKRGRRRMVLGPFCDIGDAMAVSNKSQQLLIIEDLMHPLLERA